MNRKQTDIREVLSYYTESDWAACACTLVRKFGVQGGAALLKSIRDLISAINKIKGITESGLKLLGQIDSMIDRIFPGNIITRELYKRIAKINVCPAVNDLLLNIGGSVSDVLGQVELKKWMEDKHKVINGFLSETVGTVEDRVFKLMKLEGFMKLMEGCASASISDGRNYELDVTAQDKGVKSVYAPIMKNLSGIMSANITEVNGEIWAAYSENGIVLVVRKIDGSWVPSVDVVKGSAPNILFDGVNVYLYFTYLNKIQELSFLPIELGYYGIPLSLWDCGRGSCLAMPLTKQSFKGCEGIFGTYNRLVPNVVNGMGFVSFPEDCPGALSVPTNIVVTIDLISWTGIVVDSIFAKTLTYEVYEEGILIGETSSTSLSWEVLGNTNYWVKVKIVDWYGDIYRSCPSEKKLTSGFVKSLEYTGSDSSKANAANYLHFMNYDIIMEGYPEYTGSDSSKANAANYLHFMNYDIIMEEYPEYTGSDSSKANVVIFISYWPAQLS